MIETNNDEDDKEQKMKLVTILDAQIFYTDGAI